MSENDLAECSALNKMITDIECKLAFWKHEKAIAESMVQKLVEKQGVLVMRQRALIDRKAAVLEV